MRIVVNGQQAFGRAVLLTLLDRGENVVGVYCESDRRDRPPDPIKVLAQERDVPLFQPKDFQHPRVVRQLRSIAPDLVVMAYVTQFVPEAMLAVPRFGSIQFHPSLLPQHRGPSSINWPIIRGSDRTGLSIFWPDRGLDEGDILLQREVRIAEDDTVGSLYFNHLFPMGVAAMVEAVDLVREGKAPRIRQDPEMATYEGWCRRDDARVDWSAPLEVTRNLIRGTDPQPGAWTTYRDKTLQLYGVTKVTSGSDAKPGEITALDTTGVTVAAGGGEVLIRRIRVDGGEKVDASEAGFEIGSRLGET